MKPLRRGVQSTRDAGLPAKPTSENEAHTEAWYVTLAKVILPSSLLTTLWIAHSFYDRDIPLSALAWSVAVGGGLYVTVARMSCSLLILRDPPKSITLRMLLAAVIAIVCLSFALGVLTLDWLKPTP